MKGYWKTRLLSVLAGAVLAAAAGSMSAQAAPAVMKDGQIFDAEYYAAHNPDVAAAVGTDAKALYQHYESAGKAEGRAPYDPTKSAAEIVKEAQEELKKQAEAADAAVRPKNYDAAASIKTYLGKSADTKSIQVMIDTVKNLFPAATSSYVVYTFGDGKTYTLGPELAMCLMKTADDGTYVFDKTTGTYTPDETKVRAFVSWLAGTYYRTAEKGTFHTTSGRNLKLSGGFTNNPVPDTEAETGYLMKTLVTPGLHEHSPEMKGSTTYVEVDLANQKAYYYKNGKQLIATNIVTGNMSSGMGTPAGVYKLRAKVRSTYLTGANYSSYVDYWMPFIGNSIGLHDASWRSSFGGNIYKTNGSHGCVNMPRSAAKEFFDTVPVGTYVITFY